MEIVVHNKNSLFQQKFQNTCNISTGIPNLGAWCKNDPIGLPESESDKKIRLHPKKTPTPYDSGTATLVTNWHIFLSTTKFLDMQNADLNFQHFSDWKHSSNTSLFVVYTRAPVSADA